MIPGGPGNACTPCGMAEPAGAPRGDAGDRFWLYVGIAAVFAGQGMMFGLGVNLAGPEYDTPTYWILHGVLALSAVVVFLLLGPGLVRETLAAVRRRRVTVEGLFFLSLCGAMGASVLATLTGEGAIYYEVVAVVLAVYAIGKRVGDGAKGRVFAAVERLRAQWDYAEVVEDHGAGRIVPIDAIRAGTRVRVAAGGVVPVDGVVVRGVAEVEEAAITGEPTPRVVRPGMRVMAGGRTLDGVLEIESAVAGRRRGIDAILRVVEQAPDSPSRLQEEADRLMRFFLPVVVVVSLGTFIGWWLGSDLGWARALFNAMAVLLVACPCALGLATPMAIWGGLQRMAERGLVVERATLLDAMARTRMIFFDKTGTLSDPDPVVVDVVAAAEDRSVVRDILAEVEAGWNHPVAAALTAWTGGGTGDVNLRVESSRLIPGAGVAAQVRIDGTLREVRVGSEDLFTAVRWTGFDDLRRRLFGSLERPTGRVVGIGWDRTVRAVFRIRESLRPGAEATVSALGEMGIGVRILTGDREPERERIGGVRVEAAMRPEDKVEAVRASREAGESPLMLGDGLNDAGAMALAAGSIAMDSGTDLTRHRADAVLAGGRWEVLPELIRVSRSIHRGIGGNLRFAAIYNGIGMTLAAAGQLHPVVAALLMVGSSFWVSIRATRSVTAGSTVG